MAQPGRSNGDPRHYLRIAAQALEARDRPAVIEALTRLTQTKPPLGASWALVVKMAQRLQEANLAVEAQKALIAEEPHNFEHEHALGALYMHFGRMDEAIALGKRLVEVSPLNHHARQFLGVAYSTVGKPSDALHWFRKALEVQPYSAQTWLSLVQQKRFTANDADLKALKAAVAATPEHPQEAKGTILFALGKALDDIDDVDGAFDAYDRGSKLVGGKEKYDYQAAVSFVDETVSVWTRSFSAQLSPSSVLSDRVTFVMGLPRSGTTLTEQIVVAHSAFVEGAETAMFGRAAIAMTDFRPSTVLAVDRDPRWAGQIWTQIGQSYLRMMAERFGDNGRLVDKTLHYTRCLGAIAQALPNAKFIWLRRDPGAVAWSCFRTRFVEGIEWSWSLSDIGRHFRLEDRLFEHWTKQFPERILPLQYEDLVKQPEQTIPRMFQFLGLPDEKATRNFHDVESVVRTASVAQVRQPLYTGSVSGWRRYEQKMKPFFDAYHGG